MLIVRNPRLSLFKTTYMGALVVCMARLAVWYRGGHCIGVLGGGAGRRRRGVHVHTVGMVIMHSVVVVTGRTVRVAMETIHHSSVAMETSRIVVVECVGGWDIARCAGARRGSVAGAVVGRSGLGS